MNEINAWAGMRLSPSLHESSFSAIMRFAWQNVLDAYAMQRILTGRLPSPHGDSFLNASWLSHSGLDEIVNWQLPNVYERELQANFSGCESLFFSRRLKVCPICFPAGFHSNWHQLNLLHHCLLHNCELIENCQHCGVGFGDFRFSINLFKRPYLCHACKAPMAGAETTLELLLDQRQELASATCFDATARWFRSGRDELFLLRAIAESTKIDSAVDNDGRQLLLVDVANVLHPFPKVFSHETRNSGMTLLAWNIDARPINDNGFLKKRQDIARCNSNRAMTRTIYSVSLRKLQSWLLTWQGQSKLEAAFSVFSEDGILGLSDLDSSTIAFVLFRNCFESSPSPALATNFRPSGFRLDYRPPFKLYLCAEREPRLAYYAIYLAIYAALYWRVERFRASGRLSQIRIGDLDSMLTKFLLRSDRRLAGGVIFRTVPSLPIPRTLSRTFEQAKESFTSAVGFQAIFGQFS